MLTIHNPKNLEQLKRLGRLIEDSQDTDLQGTMSELRELTGQLKAIQLQSLETQQEQRQQSSPRSSFYGSSNQYRSTENRGRFSQPNRRGGVYRGYGRAMNHQSSSNWSQSTGGRGYRQSTFRGRGNNSPRTGWMSNQQTRSGGYSTYRGRLTFFSMKRSVTRVGSQDMFKASVGTFSFSYRNVGPSRFEIWRIIFKKV